VGGAKESNGRRKSEVNSGTAIPNKLFFVSLFGSSKKI